MDNTLPDLYVVQIMQIFMCIVHLYILSLACVGGASFFLSEGRNLEGAQGQKWRGGSCSGDPGFPFMPPINNVTVLH